MIHRTSSNFVSGTIKITKQLGIGIFSANILHRHNSIVVANAIFLQLQSFVSATLNLIQFEGARPNPIFVHSAITRFDAKPLAVRLKNPTRPADLPIIIRKRAGVRVCAANKINDFPRGFLPINPPRIAVNHRRIA